MEVFFDRGRKTPVVVDLCLQLIYCVLQTSYSKTLELIFLLGVVSLGGVDCLFGFVELGIGLDWIGLDWVSLPALDLPWCPFFSIVCVLVTGLVLPTNRVLKKEEEDEIKMEMEMGDDGRR